MDHSLEQILELCKKHVPAWESVESPEWIKAQRMSGLSNACYRVTVLDDSPVGGKVLPKSLLLRFFLTEIVDLRIEHSIFQIMSDAKTGPFCYFCNDTYRVEEFVISRPITVFEMRNPVFLNIMGKFFAEFAYNKEITESVTKIREGNTKTQT